MRESETDSTELSIQHAAALAAVQGDAEAARELADSRLSELEDELAGLRQSLDKQVRKSYTDCCAHCMATEVVMVCGIVCMVVGGQQATEAG